MNLLTVIILIALAAAVFFAVRSIWNHRGRCGCCDGSCHGCRSCRKG